MEITITEGYDKVSIIHLHCGVWIEPEYSPRKARTSLNTRYKELRSVASLLMHTLFENNNHKNAKWLSLVKAYFSKLQMATLFNAYHVIATQDRTVRNKDEIRAVAVKDIGAIVAALNAASVEILAHPLAKDHRGNVNVKYRALFDKVIIDIGRITTLCATPRNYRKRQPVNLPEPDLMTKYPNATRWIAS